MFDFIIILILLCVVLPILVISGINFLINKIFKNRFNPNEKYLEELRNSKARSIVTLILSIIVLVGLIFDVLILQSIIYSLIILVLIMHSLWSLKYLKTKQSYENTYKFVMYRDSSMYIIVVSILIVIMMI